MAKTKTGTKLAYKCNECGWMTAKWTGRCGECQAWGTIEEAGVTPATARTAPVAVTVDQLAQPITEIDATHSESFPTGVSEFDRVLGSGLVPGAVILLAGEPGIGKSTMALDIAGQVAATRRDDQQLRTTLYLTGEESAAQVRLRAERIGAMHKNLLLSAETDLGQVLGQIEHIKPDFLVIDSVQTIQSAAIDGTPGGRTQIQEVTSSVIRLAKRHNIATILVGHVTKEGSIAGPRTMEHLVDVVCQFHGDRHSQLRFIRSVKNRYGSTDEVGCFSMNDSGITSIDDPSGLFINTFATPAAGTAITVALDGHRPLMTELQALVSKGTGGSPRRVVTGLVQSRLNTVVAIISRHLAVDMTTEDIYASTVGGISVYEPAADLAIAAAIYSSRNDLPLPRSTILIGELSLAGEIRPAVGMELRLKEAHRLGFTHAIIPDDDEIKVPKGMRVLRTSSLAKAMSTLFEPSRRPPPRRTHEEAKAELISSLEAHRTKKRDDE